MKNYLIMFLFFCLICFLEGCPSPGSPEEPIEEVEKVIVLTAEGIDSRAIRLSWTCNFENADHFWLESSTVSPTQGFVKVTSPVGNATSYDHASGITPEVTRWYRIKATFNSKPDSPWSNTVEIKTPAPHPHGCFKVLNQWEKGNWENVPDGACFLTYEAAKQAQVYGIFFDDKVDYRPTLMAVFFVSHPIRGECTIVVGLGPHDSPVRSKKFFPYNPYQFFDHGAGMDDIHPFPVGLIAMDISEFAPDINDYNLFLEVNDYGPDSTPEGYAYTGAIIDFQVEKYDPITHAIATHYAVNLPINTINGQKVYVDINTAGNIGPVVSRTRPYPRPANASDYLNYHHMTDFERAELEQAFGVAEKGKNYNQIINGFGTGLRPPTMQEWEEMQKSVLIPDALKGAVNRSNELPSSVDLSKSKYFPPVGNQGSKGSCVSYSMIYSIKLSRKHSNTIGTCPA
ncbi:MAG: hypothetical protein JW969_20395 [Spirochaetales bacterium]|nr:hypothetical protein [Spirochaetales bacterium]